MIIGCHFTKTRIFSTYLENFICYFVGLKNADCNSLEKVQEKFVKNVRGLRTTDYRDRLRELGILTLVDRRQCLDLVEVFKIIKGFNNVCRSDYFTCRGTWIDLQPGVVSFPSTLSTLDQISRSADISLESYFAQFSVKQGNIFGKILIKRGNIFTPEIGTTLSKFIRN